MKQECLGLQPIKITPTIPSSYQSKLSIVDNCSYKIGNMVFIVLRLSITSNISANNAILTGFPKPYGTTLSSAYSIMGLGTNSKRVILSAGGEIMGSEDLTANTTLSIGGAYVGQ